jgi:hypothetical protein
MIFFKRQRIVFLFISISMVSFIRGMHEPYIFNYAKVNEKLSEKLDIKEVAVLMQDSMQLGINLLSRGWLVKKNRRNYIPDRERYNAIMKCFLQQLSNLKYISSQSNEGKKWELLQECNNYNAKLLKTLGYTIEIPSKLGIKEAVITMLRKNMHTFQGIFQQNSFLCAPLGVEERTCIEINGQQIFKISGSIQHFFNIPSQIIVALPTQGIFDVTKEEYEINEATHFEALKDIVLHQLRKIAFLVPRMALSADKESKCIRDVYPCHPYYYIPHFPLESALLTNITAQMYTLVYKDSEPFQEEVVLDAIMGTYIFLKECCSSITQRQTDEQVQTIWNFNQNFLPSQGISLDDLKDILYSNHRAISHFLPVCANIPVSQKKQESIDSMLYALVKSKNQNSDITSPTVMKEKLGLYDRFNIVTHSNDDLEAVKSLLSLSAFSLNKHA